MSNARSSSREPIGRVDKMAKRGPKPLPPLARASVPKGLRGPKRPPIRNTAK